jgi:hypothetical protein
MLTTTDSLVDAPVAPDKLPLFEPYESAAGGWGALQDARSLAIVAIGAKLRKRGKYRQSIGVRMRQDDALPIS